MTPVIAVVDDAPLVSALIEAGLPARLVGRGTLEDAADAGTVIVSGALDGDAEPIVRRVRTLAPGAHIIVACDPPAAASLGPLLAGTGADVVASRAPEALAAAIAGAAEPSVEEALRESEAVTRAILTSALDAVVTMTGDGFVLEWNHAAERLFGYTREQAVGRRVSQLIVPPALRERHETALRRTVVTGESTLVGRRVKLPALRRDGTQLLVEIAIARIDVPRGPAFAAYLRDITETDAEARLSEAQHGVARALAEAPTLQEATPRILDELCESLGFDFGELWARDGDVMRCVEIRERHGARTPAMAEATLGATRARGQGLVGLVWERNGAVWLDVRDAPEALFPRLAAARADGIVSVFAFPITSGHEVIGLIGLHSREYRQPDPAVERTAQAIGSQVGQFMERRAAEEESAFQRALLASQNEATIDGIVVVAPDGTIISHNQRFLDMWNLRADMLVGRGEAALERVLEQVSDPEEFMADLVRVSSDLRTAERRELDLKDGRIFERYCAPLYAEDRSVRGRAWYYRDITDRKRTERAIAEASQRFAFLAEAGALLAASLDYQETLRALARIAVPFLADWCVVDVVETDGSISRIAISSADPSGVESVQPFVHRRHADLDPTASRGAPKVLRTGEAEIVEEIPREWLRDAAGGDEVYARFLESMDLRSYMCVPLVARGRTLGAITFVTAASGRRYGPAELALATDLARRAALSVDNARLYADRAYVAHTLQRSLLPPALPEIPGLEVAAEFHPAGEGNEVGGDFFDLFDTGRDDWAIMVGDVCGKGADAAALTALARYTIRAAAMQARKPSRVLAMLNEAILRQTSDDRFCTVAYTRVRQGPDGTHRLTLAAAGHPLPLILRANGAVETVGRAGTVLGVVASPRLKDRLAMLEPGDAVVLYTDGVTEARSPAGEFFGEERLRATLRAAAGGGAGAIAEAIRTAALGFQHGVARDDIAVVVFRVKPAPRGR